MNGFKVLGTTILFVMFVFGSFGLYYYLPTWGYSEWWMLGLAISALWLGFVFLAYCIAGD